MGHKTGDTKNCSRRQRSLKQPDQGTESVIKGSFLWPTGLKETPIRVPMQGIPESKRKPEYIAPEEVESAMKLVAQYALGISDDSLIAETAKVFGINHSGEEAKAVFSEVLKRLVRERKLVCKDDGVVTAA